MAWTLPLSLPVLPSLEWLETHSERLICEVQFRSTNHQHQSKMLFPFKTSAVADKSPISSLHFDRLSALTSDLIYFPNAGFKVKRLFVISIWSVSLRIGKSKSNKPKITVACNSQATLTSIFIIPTNRSLFNLTRVSSKEIVFSLDISGSSKGHWEFSAHPPNIVDYVTFM